MMCSAQKYPASANYPDLSQHVSIMATCLTPEIYAQLYDKKTSNGVTLDQCIQCGVDHPGHHRGTGPVACVAGDEESYSLFALFFDKVISLRTGGYNVLGQQPTDLDATKIRDGQLDENYVLSVRVRVCRNIRGWTLPPVCCRAQRREVEGVVTRALSQLGGDLKGRYTRLRDATEEDQEKLIADHMLFERPRAATIVSAGVVRDWPDARGCWTNHSNDFMVWVNEEDHMRQISLRKGGDMKRLFEQFCKAITRVEDAIKGDGYEYMYNDHLGYISTHPSNLGTGLRASVHIHLPNLGKDPQFEQVLRALGLHKRGTGGVHTDVVGDVFDVSNSVRLGMSEVQLVQAVIDGVNVLVKMEKKLEEGESIDDLVPDDGKHSAGKQ